MERSVLTPPCGSEMERGTYPPLLNGKAVKWKEVLTHPVAVKWQEWKEVLTPPCGSEMAGNGKRYLPHPVAVKWKEVLTHPVAVEWKGVLNPCYVS